MNHGTASRSLPFKFIAALFVLLLGNAQVVLAEESAKTEDANQEAQGSINVEVKPLALNSLLIPGVAGFGFGVEKQLDSNWTLFSEFNYLSSRGSLSGIKRIQDDISEQRPIIQKLDALALGLGTRYYVDTTDDSWYGGARLNLIRLRSTWVHVNEKLRTDSTQIAPTIDGGYRWVGDTGYNVRLGLVAQVASFGPSKISRDNDSSVSLEGERKLKKNDVYGGKNFFARFPISVDLGVGYLF